MRGGVWARDYWQLAERMGVGLSFCFHSNVSGLWWVSNGVVTQGDRLNAMATPTVTLNDVRQTLKKWDKVG